jgi:hypothetical protein
MMSTIAAPPGLSLPMRQEERSGWSRVGSCMKTSFANFDADQEEDTWRPSGAKQARAVAPPPGFAPIASPPGLEQIPEDGQASSTEEVQRSVFSIADHLGITDDEPAPTRKSKSLVGAGGYQELQKNMYEKKQLEKKLKRLEALVTCVEDIKEMQRSASLAPTEPMAEPAARPACLWSKKESSKHPGKFYYVHSETKKTSWTKPEDYVDAVPAAAPSVMAAPPAMVKKQCPIDLADYYDGSTDDAGSSESDDACDSDTLLGSVSSRTSSLSPSQYGGMSMFRASAPAFKPSSKNNTVSSSKAGFRADAPVFCPGMVSSQ